MHSDIISVSLLTCSTLIHEENGPLSAIRISSVVQVPAGAQPKVDALLTVKTEAGKSGNLLLRIVIVNPDGVESDYDFAGDNNLPYQSLIAPEIPGGAIFAFSLSFAIRGTHWIKVLIDEELAVRTPITIRSQ
jgi:hypothetical protein